MASDLERFTEQVERDDLKSEGDPRNEPQARRALRALAAVQAFAHAGRSADRLEPVEDIIADLLANLRHLCERTGISFDDADDTARANYVVERHGDI